MNEVICGALLDNDVLTPLSCNVDTGEVHFPDFQGMELLISELSVTDPVDATVEAVSEDMQENHDEDVIGLLYCERGTYIFFSDDTFQLMDDEGAMVGERVHYDTNCEYDSGDEE